MNEQAQGRGQKPVAVVTGGSRGIGAAVCRRLARSGWQIALCYRSNSTAAEEVSQHVRAEGSAVYSERVDVGDAAAVVSFVDSVERSLGEIDALVTCAGIVDDGPMIMMTDDSWQRVLRTNLDGSFHICRAVAFRMAKRRRGSIVTMASVAGVYGNPGQTNYSASKAGVIGMSSALAKELAGRGIRVNVVAPGFIETDMTGDLTDADQIRKAIPLGRFGAADEVASVVAFLCSQSAAYVTGQVLGVDGGLVV